MNTDRHDALMTDGMAELLGGVGSAAPGALFLVDASGKAHPLNGLARDLPPDDPTAEAFVSPVLVGPRGAGRTAQGAGHVVGYLRPGASEQDAPLVAALVALAAQVLSRRQGAEPDDFPELPAATFAPAQAEDVLDDARRRLGTVISEAAVGDIVVEAARMALGARVTVLLASVAGGALEPLATRGCEGLDVESVKPGQGLLGWAAERPVPTHVRNFAGIPSMAPRCEGSRCALPSWLAPPFALIPIRVGPELTGLLCVAGLPRRSGQDASARAATLLERLADKAAASLAGARMLIELKKQERIGREVEIARQIQRSLLPQSSLAFQGLELAGECRSASQVGGDFFGFRAQGDRLMATLFDVAGHGIGAALCMTLVRSALHGEIARGGDPSEVLGRANALAWEDLSESSLFATAFLARFDRERGALEYASAGHALPILWQASTRSFVELPEGGMPLGLFADGNFPGGVVEFAPGDLLILYTDGFVDAESGEGEKFGRQRLIAAVRRARRRSAREVLRRLWRELATFAGDNPLRDDATLVVVRGGEAFGPVDRSSDPRRERSVACRRDGDAVGAARELVRAGRRRGND